MYDYQKICYEFEKWLKMVVNTYSNCPELEKYILRSKEYKKILDTFNKIKEDYIER